MDINFAFAECDLFIFATGGAGDGIRAGWNNYAQAMRNIEIKELTLRNVSAANTYQISPIAKSRVDLPDIEVLQSPYNPEYDFKIIIEEIETSTRMPTLISCHYSTHERPEILHLFHTKKLMPTWREIL